VWSWKALLETVASSLDVQPAKLGRYEILKPLAQGGMAEVLLARATGIEGFERHVVIKRIRAEQARNTQFVKMFLDEARLAAALHHQNIVQVHDIGQEDGEYFFTMEYVHGEDVRTLLRQASSKRALMPIAHAITIVAAAAAGLHHAHEQRGPGGKSLGIVHRDVSPANILVGFDGGVKVVDFGIAKAAMRSAETASGTIKGKVAYMSPEQCTGQPVDRRADVFALGIVLYELVTVRRLFKADSDFLMMTAIVAGDVPPPSRLRRDLPPELEEIIRKALWVDPDARDQTADVRRLALEQFANAAGIQTSTTLLADYVKEQFGERVEPWLADSPPWDDADVDFDGSASSIIAMLEAGTTAAALAPNASPSSPLIRARAKEITRHPPTGSGTPLAWTTEEPAPPPPRSTTRRWFVVGLAVAIAVVSVVAMTSGHEPDKVQPASGGAATTAHALSAGPDAGVTAAVTPPDAAFEATIHEPTIATPVVPPTHAVVPAHPIKPIGKPTKPTAPAKPTTKPATEDLDSPFPH